jgi:DNA-binding LytR/AlgR family response regulator
MNRRLNLSRQTYFFIQCGQKGNFVRVEKSDIHYIESALNYVRVQFEREQHLTYLTLAEIGEMLPADRFIRLHKSFIVNMDKVLRIEGNTVFLSGNKEVVMGQSYREAFFQHMAPLMVLSKRRC